MTISSVTSGSIQPVPSNNAFAATKKSFDNLENALQSGNLTAAKAAFTQLQNNAPPKAKQSDNPISAKVDALGKALDSGDLSAAQAAFADLKKTISQNPPPGGAGGPPPGGSPPGGPPPHGARPHGKHEGGPKGGSSTDSTSSSDKVYDVRDTNKDGKVSAQEQLAYDLKYPTQAAQVSASSATSETLTTIDTFA